MLDLEMHAAAFTLQGVRGPRQRAKELVARARGLRPDSVTKRIRRESDKVPESYLSLLPTAEGLLRIVAKMADDGEIALDPDHGFKWLDPPDGPPSTSPREPIRPDET